MNTTQITQMFDAAEVNSGIPEILLKINFPALLPFEWYTENQLYQVRDQCTDVYYANWKKTYVLSEEDLKILDNVIQTVDKELSKFFTLNCA